MICMASSMREGKRCVAGIDMKTGQWIRPVPPGGGGIPNYRVFFDTRDLQPLDVVELTLNPPLGNTKYQRENRVMPAWDWKIVGQATPDQLLPWCDFTAPVLHTATDWVAPSELDKLPPAQWKSLQLVHSARTEFVPDRGGGPRWRIRFRDKAGNPYSLKITDALVCNRLSRGEKFKSDCLLTVSLTEPWAPADGAKPELCYKLVAAVVELP
jgi:hypothetical protein